MYYAMILGAAALFGADFAVYKIYQKHYGVSQKAVFLFNMLLGLAVAAVFFVINGCKMHVSWFSLLMAGLMSIFVMAYSILGFRILKYGTMAMYTLFLMTGGMTLPYLFGLIFLGEPFSVLRLAALIIIIAGVALSNYGAKMTNGRMLLLCVLVFFLNGFVSISSKIHQATTVYHAVNTSEFMVLSGLLKFLMAAVFYGIACKKDPSGEKPSSYKLAVLLSVCSALAGGIGSLLNLTAAKYLSASIQYPFLTGGTIVISTLIGVIAFKEKISKITVFSIILCVIGTILMV